MDTVNITSIWSADNCASVEAKRVALAEANGRAYGAMRDYAAELNNVFASLSITWFTVEANDNGAEQNLIHAEKKALYTALHANHPSGKHPNPSVVWARVRTYGAEELKQAFDTVEGEEGEEGEGESSGGARHTRSLSLRLIEELTTLFKAGQKATRDGTITNKEAEAQTHVGFALYALGVDTNSLK